MYPGSFVNNGIDSWMGNAILTRQVGGESTLSMTGANVTHGIFVQFRIEIIRADMYTAPGASLARTILHIVNLITQPQVRRIHASWIVTLWAIMANVLPFWNRAIMQFIRKTMCSVESFPRIERPISPRLFARLPQPAIVRPAPVYLLPETLNRWTRLVLMAVDESSLSGWKLGSGDRLSASALTKPRRIRWCNMRMLAFPMPRDVLDGLAFDLSPSSSVSAGYRCFSSASTMAVTVRDFVRGMIGVHENLHFSAKAQDAANVAGQFLLGCRLPNYSTNVPFRLLTGVTA